ncbi:MAG: hypothetical protein P0Y49_05705 [Candidatus Pedobacter colombiensis]|uniref:Uncharacterized protein n=1 Tax=Candidatus Pedobacter colombiensis TaxID=3121371 RepID=A0AAJ5W9T3_9SPHI|nr:hypothetical protein [Pedobacter sp.]WEK20631.1 MAG: hypothetical protein P0Y49_05705 [Pedobacter sp.]
MKRDQISSMLNRITGNLLASSPAENVKILGLKQSLANVLITQETSPDLTKQFTFTQSDLFQSPITDQGALQDLDAIISKAERMQPMADMQVIVRDSPIRTTQIAGSISTAIAGARVSETIGPLKDLSGRDIFVDYIKIQKLIPLYIQGSAEPAILFKTSLSRMTIINPTPTISKIYKVDPNTVWINVRLFTSTAPADSYFGLRVTEGTINLSVLPTLNAAGQLTISSITEVTVALLLEQKNVVTPAVDTPYGVDARNAEFNMPKAFNFSFKGVAKTIQSVAPFGCKVYGRNYNFSYAGNQNVVFNPLLNRIAIPVNCMETAFHVLSKASPFINLEGTTNIKNSWWTIPTAIIDITKPLEADSNGGIVLECATGLQSNLVNTEEVISLNNPFIILEPGRVAITDLISSGVGLQRVMETWKDEFNTFGTTVEINYLKDSLFIYNTVSEGTETLNLLADVNFKADRPIKANGEAIAIQSKKSVLMFGATKSKKSILIYDDNILWDNALPTDKIPVVKPFALAMNNALFTVTPPNGAVLYGEYNEAITKIFTADLFLSFGMFSYLPTLPDPYAANLGALKVQFPEKVVTRRIVSKTSMVWMWLVCRIQWYKKTEETDIVNVSFQFAPLTQSVNVIKEQKSTGKVKGNVHPIAGSVAELSKLFVRDANTTITNTDSLTYSSIRGAVVPQNAEMRDPLNFESFTLLDVSSNANQMGVAYAGNKRENLSFLRKMGVVFGADQESGQVFPLQMSGLDVVTQGYNVRAFTVPQISWEPLLNLTKPGANPKWADASNDPPLGWNYYPNDGLATRIGNVSPKPVALSPIPMAKYLEQMYRDNEDGKTYAVFNLPFGMFAAAVLDKNANQKQKPNIQNVSPLFDNYIHGGIQLELTAGSSFKDEDNLFQGYTVQVVNVLDMYGKSINASTLGASVEKIFKDEFTNAPDHPDITRPGVPLKKIALSGYGASAFSDWHNKNAAFAETSQATFNVATGRTAHEVVQVKSVIYPWGIFVVRTVTIFRMSNGYVGRIDSGWQAESDGKFYFGVNKSDNPYEIHAGVVNGLYNIRNIRENELGYEDTMDIKKDDFIFDAETNKSVKYKGPTYTEKVRLRGLTFDADIAIENVVEGAGSNHLVPSKGVLGFVQISPRGTPVSKEIFASLLKYQNGTIGAAVNCTIKVAGTDQYMKVSRVDVNNSVGIANQPIFVGAVRGAVVLPKDGSWSMVNHNRSDGTVTSLPQGMSVPLIRVGKWDRGKLVHSADANNLQRIAHPTELLRAPTVDTINYGFLQNLSAQKVLYLTPAFKSGINSLLSKTPPLLADSYRLLNTKGIFPNIGNADDDLGTAIQLLKGKADGGQVLEAFSKVKDGAANVLDGSKEVFEILSITAKSEAGKLVDQGFKLLKQKADQALNDVFKFDLPALEYPLIDTEGLKIYIQYAVKGSTGSFPGKMDYNVDSFATAMADQWKGRMNNMAMVIDLGPLKGLMTIKGNFNSQKGAESNYGSNETSDADSLPTPEIEFSKDLEPVIQVLDILAKLSAGDYASAFKKGLKVAMSNSANIWEYKFEAGKDIPLVKFPLGALYDAPQVPLKLEASLSLGVYFNAALKVTTDPKQLLPTVGAFFKFHGGLQVMCFSVGAGSVYAVGNVDLKLSADTSPLIALDMKFGFGIQLGVGLPVIGNVSVLFMAGVEIYVDSSQTVIVTAFLLFRGHAEILGGLVGVTITIEAKGAIEKKQDPGPTNCKASVSFGLDISVFLVIDISFHESWEETRQIA